VKGVRALVARRRGDTVSLALADLDPGELGEGDVVVDIAWSGVNYKDMLAVRADGNVARLDLLVPGIDLAGTVAESGSQRFNQGDRVLAHGYGLGVSHHGGFATRACVPASWLVRLPRQLGPREAMILGTPGFTAALCLARLESVGIGPGSGPVLVTGATGGVGSLAVAILARRGFDVAASTGKAGSADWLRGLGASAVLDRRSLEGPTRPLEAQRFAAAIDCVGGSTLAHVLSLIAHGGAVAACGVVGGSALSTTVFPFILRGVALLGVDSTATPIEQRAAVWDRLAADLLPADVEVLVDHEVGLDGLAGAFDQLARGAVQGRVLVRPA
jgi:acrylyl-CoA reductase (NADPH)